MGKNKGKKEKVRYYDDGRTIADMSGVKDRRLPGGDPLRPRATAKQKWDTYWNAVKMMFGPMLVVVAGIGLIYVIMYVLFGLM